jgi:DNA-3-methyladenine glycosylase II
LLLPTGMAKKREATAATSGATPPQKRAQRKRMRSGPHTDVKAAAPGVEDIIASLAPGAPKWAVEGLRHVATADGGRLGSMLVRSGAPDYLSRPVEEDSACAALCRIIIGQQLAGAAATTIWRRTLAVLCPAGFSAPAILAATQGRPELSDETRKACGLSRAKARAVVGVARAFEARELTDAILRDSSTPKLRERLTALNGVGPWSCDMFLMFHLKKADVLPLGDLGVRAGAARAFEIKGHGKNGALDQKKDAAKLESCFAPFAPYRSLASWLMWQIVDTKAFTQDTDDA